LFDLKGVELLRLGGCHITLRKSLNAADPVSEAVVIAVDRPGPKASANTDGAATPARQPMTIELQNCIVRGEAKLASVAGGVSTRIVCDNSLLVLADQVLDIAAPAEGAQNARVEFEARHLTLDAGQGLLTVNRLRGNDKNLSVDLRVVDSILRSAPGAALIADRSIRSADDDAIGIGWSGNRNFYEGFDVFWQQSNDRNEKSRWSFTDWKAYWGPSRESIPHQNAVVWDLPAAQHRPASEAVPADYVLSTSTASNPARDAASDGLDAGCLIDLLPPLP
jgi:hypothetical protein